jgi:hypothetical protein
VEKMSNIRTSSGERLSFSKLFSEKGYHIEIPIIQRDFAQGRSSSSEVREVFLEALFNYLDNGKPNMDLDFIYGSLSKSNEQTSFIPLDGQQRLTTLFLLHWYLANISGNEIVFRNLLTYNQNGELKSKFTYETRSSSREFCDALVSHDIDLNPLLHPQSANGTSVSCVIRDAGWYFLSWDHDPTIQAMLNMLDSIHQKFYRSPDFFELLISSDNPVITFLFLNLREFGLSDDLYIKMNARGKPLTNFENFKAKLEQHLGELNWLDDDNRILVINTEQKSVDPKNYFSNKIDTAWANFFWSYRNVNGRDISFDNELMNFIRVILANHYAIESIGERDDSLEHLIGTQVARRSKDFTDNLTFRFYFKHKALKKEAVVFMIDALESLCNEKVELVSHLEDHFFFDEQEIFKDVLRHDLTFPQRIQFHAYVKYLILNKGKIEGLYQWMRVVHNLTENTIIDGADHVARAIKSIERLVPKSDSILEFISDSKVPIDFFHGRQVQEERIKANLIRKSKEWEDEIELIEKHPYFKGQILYIFEFCGILEYYEENGACNWDNDEDLNFRTLFSNYGQKANQIFTAISNSSGDIDYLWERAVLSKGDYTIKASAYRRNLLNTSAKTRDFSWKRLLRLPVSNNDNEVKYWKKRRSFVKEVLDDHRYDPSNLINSLKNICSSIPSDWRGMFVENPEFLEYCKQGFIRVESPTKIYLFKQSQLNHYHREAYSYSLYLNSFRGADIFHPFKTSWYYEVRSSDEFCVIILTGWKYQKSDYAFEIQFDTGDKDFLPNPYEIRFLKRYNNARENYSDDIVKILIAEQFEWKSSYLGFWKSVETDREVITLLLEICAEFQNL